MLIMLVFNCIVINKLESMNVDILKRSGSRNYLTNL